jgi:LPXTG-site transpeptidase (sortase) family protein
MLLLLSSPNRKFSPIKSVIIFLILLLITLPTTTAYAAACTATTSGNWSSASTWSCGHVPTSSDDVMIGNGLSITVDVPAVANSVTLNNGNASTTLTIGGSNSLNVTGDITLINTTSATNKVLAVGAGTLTIGGNLNLNEGGGTQITRLTISTGTVSVNGNITVNPGGTLTNAQVVFSGAGTLNIAGAYPAGTTLTTAGAGTVNFTGAAQTVPAYTYYYLGLSGSGVKTLPNFPAAIGGNLTLSNTVSAATTGNVTVTGTLNIGSGSAFTTGNNFTLTVTGTTTVGGTLTLGGTGAKTFTGNVTVNSGGTYIETGAATITYSGSLANNGTYTASTGTHTFAGAAAKTISGTNAITIPTLTISGATTNNARLNVPTTLTISAATTNNGILTVPATLAGASTLTNAATGILNFGGASITPTLTASAAGNTVNYTGAAQTVKATTYSYLILSGSGVKSLPVGTIVNSNLNIIHAGGATASIAAGTLLAVNSLALDGVGQTTPPFPTTWGGTGSGATHINSTYFAATTGRLNVAAADARTIPIITFGSAPTPSYLGGPFTVSATTTNTDSSILVYSVVSGPCVFVGGTIFNSTGAGTCVVQASGAPTTNFASATATQSITIAKASQATLTVSANPAVVVQGFTTTLSNSGGSGTGAVTFSVGSSTGCTLAGNIVTVTDASGTCNVTVTKAADANYLSATSAVLPITLATYQAEINKDFSPTNILPGSISHLSIKVYNPNAFALQNVAWVDNLIGVQLGIRLASAVNLANDCGGTVTALPGGSIVSLSGGSVPAKVGATNGVCTVTVDVTSTTAGNLINTIPAGILDATDGSGKRVTNTTPASATLQVNTIIAPTVNKNFNAATIWAGQNSRLTINLLNQDPANALTGVSVTDTLPENVVISSTVFLPALTNCGGGTLTATPGTRTITLSGAGIPAGVGQTCVIQVNITSSTQGSYINTIPGGAIQTAQGVTNAQQAQATLSVQQLNLTKAFAPATIPAGANSIATITLQNPTGVTYTNVGLIDNLPAGMTYVSTGAGSCGGSIAYNAGLNQIIFSGGTLPGYVSGPFPKTCTIIFTVTTPATLGTTTLTNTIPAGTLTNDQNISNPATVTANLTVNGAITGSKSFSPTTITQGNPSLATVTLTNNTATPITGVTMTDTLTGGLILYSAAPYNTPPNLTTCGGSYTGNAGDTTVTMTGGTIPANSSCLVRFQVTANSPVVRANTIGINGICGTEGALGIVCNQGAIASGNLTVSASALPVVGAKGFCAAGPCPAGATNNIAVGGSSAMSIRLTAPADTNLTGFNVTDTLPAGMTIFNTTTSTAACIGGTLNVTAGAGSFSWTGGTINAGTTCIITVNVTTSASGMLTNTINPIDIGNGQGRILSAAFSANLNSSNYLISKSFTPTTINQNGSSTLRITLTNQYLTALTNVNVTDSLATMGGAPNNVVVASGPAYYVNNGCGGIVTAIAGSSTITLASGSIPAKAGPDGTCTIDVNVTGLGASGARTNTIPIANVTANVSGTTVNPRAPATAILTVAPLTISVNKSFSPLTVFGGSASTLTVTLSNPNNAQLTGIAFSDNLPSGMYIALPANLNTGSCGGILSGNPGDTSFSYSGGTLAATASCDLTLSVSTNVSGNLTNIIPINAVTSFNGAKNPQATQASLTNLGGVSVDKIFETNPITIGATSILRIRITNSSNFTLTNLGLADTLPIGLVIAASPAPTNGCGGSLLASTGTRTISLATGSVAASALCDITVPVTGNAPGSYTNIIPINTITNTQGYSNTDETRDTLVINPASPTLTTSAAPTTGTVGVNIPSVGDSATLNGGYSPTGSVTFTLYNDNTCTTAVPGMSGSGTISGNSASWSTSWTPSAAGTYYWRASYPGDANNDSYTTSCADANEQILIGKASPTITTTASPTSGTVGFDIVTAGDSATITGGYNPTGSVTFSLYSDNTCTTTVPGMSGSGTISGNSASWSTSWTPSLSGNYYWRASYPGDTNNNAFTTGCTDTNEQIVINDVASLGDFVWNDLNADGIQDSGEPGINNVTVRLLDAAGTTTLDTTTTDSSGNYLFNNLTPGDYRVEFVLPSGFTFSPQDQGANDAVDSDANATTGRTVSTTLSSGESDLTWDAGMYQTTSLGDFVWNDLNANGIQDAGEPGISGVTVRLLDSAGTTTLATITTDASGNYLFDNLTPGDYRVEFVLPSGYTFSPQDQGANDAVDSDANATSGRTVSTTLTSGENDLTWDAGMYQTASLGDFVWNDLNADGIQDAGEPGISGVTVNLYDGSSTFITSTATDTNGNYIFNNLTPGDYSVRFIIPSGYTFSPQDQGANDAVDSDANTTTGRTVSTTLSSGESDLTWDAGMYQTASLGDFVWNDLNANGIQDTGEPGISSVTVNLSGTDNLGNPVSAATTTDSSGNYLFNNLTPGDYQVEFVLPSGFTFSPQDQGANDAVDSDANIATGATGPYTLVSNENNTTIDAGMFMPDMTVSKTISAISYVNPTVMRLTYLITLTNTTGIDLNNVQTTDDLQVTFGATPFTIISLTASSLTGNTSYDGVGDINLLTGNDTLSAGSSGTITLIVNVNTGGLATTHTNTVIATGEPPLGPTVIRTSSVTGPVFADPAVTKTADATVAMVGDQVNFTITVTNIGNQTATDVTVTDPLPANMDYVSASSTPVGTISLIAPRTVEVAIGDVAVGDVITILINARVNSLGSPPIQNIVSLSTTSSTDIISNDTSSVSLDIVAVTLPSTGFAPNRKTAIPAQPDSMVYKAYDNLTLTLPSLKFTVDIVGVPLSSQGWDVTWLDKNAGWLNGTAFPTWNGNSVITGHVYLANGLPGPFVNIGKLKYGDQVIINSHGKKYTYEVRSVSTFKADDISKVLKHEDYSWITLLTCKDYDQKTNTYHNRTAVRAVLVAVQDK